MGEDPVVSFASSTSFAYRVDLAGMGLVGLVGIGLAGLAGLGLVGLAGLVGFS